jgi:tetratricopeptide (TPR) repeat protein
MPEDPAPLPTSEQSTLDLAAPSAAGSIARYRLLQRLGEGGMGEVWLAEQTEPVRRQVALKVIKAGMDSAQVVARFEAERQALALMDHPTIATVFDGGTTPQLRPYFAMEYVKGEPITAYCDRHRLRTAQRLELFMQVCEGVQHAHQKGIIHRDLKPSNVLVMIQDDHPVPKIIDFGVAKATAQHLTERTLFTELGVLIGTPEYMSPEQAEMGGLDIDTRTDIYALGVLLYELLTGALPFDRRHLRQVGLAEIQRVIREKEPPRPSTRITQLGLASTEAAKNRHTEPRRLVGELRGDLDWITMRALEKDRTRRYQTANALATDIRRHLNSEPVSAGPPSAAYRAGKFVRRHRFGVATAVTLALLLAAFAVATAVQARRIARERDKAERLATFMVDLFKGSDPREARGNTITAREVLDRGADKIRRDLTEQPQTRADLMEAMADVYDSLGLFDRAAELARESVAFRRQATDGDPPVLAMSLTILGNILMDKGDLKEAEAAYREAVEIHRRLFGPESLEVARSLNNLSSVLDPQGRYDEAFRLMEESLRIKRKRLGPDDPILANSIYNLGVQLYHRGDLAGAEKLLREALVIQRKALGEDHPDVAFTLQAVGVTLDEHGKYAEAEETYREALALQRKVLGPEHPEIVTALTNLGTTLCHAGQLAAAKEVFSEALPMSRKVFGAETTDTAAVLAGLAEVELRQGEVREAEALARESLTIREKRLGAEHQDTAESLALLGRVLLERGLFPEAENALLRAQSRLDRPEVLARRRQEVRDSLCRLYDKWGRPESAREWRMKVEAPSAAVGHSSH